MEGKVEEEEGSPKMMKVTESLTKLLSLAEELSHSEMGFCWINVSEAVRVVKWVPAAARGLKIRGSLESARQPPFM